MFVGFLVCLSQEEGKPRWWGFLVDMSAQTGNACLVLYIYFLVCLFFCHKKKVRPGGAPKQEMLVGQFIPTGASHLIDEEGDAMLFGQFCY